MKKSTVVFVFTLILSVFVATNSFSQEGDGKGSDGPIPPDNCTNCMIGG